MKNDAAREYKSVHALADYHEAHLVTQYKKAVSAIRKDVSINDLALAIQTKNVALALRVLNVQKFAEKFAKLAEVQDGARISGKRLGKKRLQAALKESPK